MASQKKTSVSSAITGWLQCEWYKQRRQKGKETPRDDIQLQVGQGPIGVCDAKDLSENIRF